MNLFLQVFSERVSGARAVGEGVEKEKEKEKELVLEQERGKGVAWLC